MRINSRKENAFQPLDRVSKAMTRGGRVRYTEDGLNVFK